MMSEIGQYSYLDYCVLQPLRSLVLSAQPAVLFSSGLDSVLWSNAPGADFFGGENIKGILDSRPSPSQPFIAQIRDAVSQIEPDLPLHRGFRLVRGLRSEIVDCQISQVKLTADDHALLLIVDSEPPRTNHSEYEVAGAAVRSLDGFAHSSAVIDDKGLIVASSKEFSTADLQPHQLASLIQRLKQEADRLIKEPLRGEDGVYFAAGIARISNTPGRSLIVLAAGDPDLSVPDSRVTEPQTDDTVDQIENLHILPETNSTASDEVEQTTTQLNTERDTEYGVAQDADTKTEVNDDTNASDLRLYRPEEPRPDGLGHRASLLLSRWNMQPAVSPFAVKSHEKPDSDEASETGKASVSTEMANLPQDKPDLEADDRSEDISAAVSKLARSDETPVAQAEYTTYEFVTSHQAADSDDTIEQDETVEEHNSKSAADVDTPIDDDDALVAPDEPVLEHTNDLSEASDLLENAQVEADFGTPATPAIVTDNETASGARGEFRFTAQEDAVRFAWTTDELKNFISISPELADTVGPNAADIVGRNWDDVASVFGFDENRAVSRLLQRKDTWSGKTILWPVQGTDLQVPIDLAALPAFGAHRNFEGFRGYGIIRTADTVVDLSATGLALSNTVPQPGSEPDPVPEENEPDLNSASTTQDFTSTTPAENNQEHRDEDTDHDEGTTDPHSNNIVSFVPKSLQENTPVLDPRDEETFSKIGEKLRETADSEWQVNQKANGTQIPVSDSETTGELPAEELSDPAVDPEPNDNETQGEDEVVNTDIIDALKKPVLIYRQNKTLFANQALLELSGYKSTEELSAAGGIDTLLSIEDELSVDGDVSQHLNTNFGTQVAVNPTLKKVPWGSEKALMLTFNLAEEAGPNQEKIALDMARISEMQNILDTATDGIVVLNKDGDIQSVNGSAEALFGISQHDTLGKNIETLFASESRDAIAGYRSSILETGLDSMIHDGREVIGKEANGGLIPLFITLGKMGSQGDLCLVIRDMTNWKKIEEDLVTAKRRAEDASEQKSDFLARVSHEIRTPLNAIIGFSDVMIEERFGPIDNERYREYLRDVNRSGIHVLDLINDLLDLSKIESGNIELSFEAVDLNLIVSETVALMQPQANSNRIIIRTSLSRMVPKVVADARSVRQIIMNLVSNAIKFSTENGQVVVSTVYESNGEVALRIRDTGAGMSALELEDAMKPFHQIPGISDKSDQGTGLGLPLTKALVEANRAHFDLESEEHHGTIAHVQFPSQRVLAD